MDIDGLDITMTQDKGGLPFGIDVEFQRSGYCQ